MLRAWCYPSLNHVLHHSPFNHVLPLASFTLSTWARWAPCHLLQAKAEGGSTATAPWLGFRNQASSSSWMSSLAMVVGGELSVAGLLLVCCLPCCHHVGGACLWPGISLRRMEAACIWLLAWLAVLPCSVCRSVACQAALLSAHHGGLAPPGCSPRQHQGQAVQRS